MKRLSFNHAWKTILRITKKYVLLYSSAGRGGLAYRLVAAAWRLRAQDMVVNMPVKTATNPNSAKNASNMSPITQTLKTVHPPNLSYRSRSSNRILEDMLTSVTPSLVSESGGFCFSIRDLKFTHRPGRQDIADDSFAWGWQSSDARYRSFMNRNREASERISVLLQTLLSFISECHDQNMTADQTLHTWVVRGYGRMNHIREAGHKPG